VIRIWRAAVLLGVAALAFAGAAFGGGRAAWFVFGAAAVLAAFGLAAGVCLGGTVRIERTLSAGIVDAGGAVRVEGTAHMPFRFPLAFVLVAETWVNGRTGRAVKGSALLVPMGRRRVPFAYELPDLERGVYRLAETETFATDFFDPGRFQAKVDGTGCERRTDRRIRRPGGGIAASRGMRDRRPPKTAAAGFGAGSAGAGEPALAGLPAFVVGPVPAACPGGMPEADALSDPAAGGVRPYAAGDPLRRIAWRPTMRAGRLLVKAPDEEPLEAVRVLVDHGREPSQFERALGAAAAFLRLMDGKAGTGRVRDAVLIDGEGEWSLAECGWAVLAERLAMMERGWSGGTKPVPRGGSVFLLATGRLDVSLAEAAIRLASAGPVRVLAAPDGRDGETERRAAERLDEAGVGVAFARPVNAPRLPAGESAAAGGGRTAV